MASLRSFVPGYDTGVKAPQAFTVSYAWNRDHNEAWPAQARGVPPASRFCCNNNGGKCCQWTCLLYTSPSPRDLSTSRMPSSA